MWAVHWIDIIWDVDGNDWSKCVCYGKVRIKFRNYAGWTARWRCSERRKEFHSIAQRQMFSSNIFFFYLMAVHHDIYVNSNWYTCHFYLNGNTHRVSPSPASIFSVIVNSFLKFSSCSVFSVFSFPFRHCCSKHRIQSIRRHKFPSLFTSCAWWLLLFFTSLELLVSFFSFNHIE